MRFNDPGNAAQMAGAAHAFVVGTMPWANPARFDDHCEIADPATIDIQRTHAVYVAV